MVPNGFDTWEHAPDADCRYDACGVFEMKPERFSAFDIVDSWGVFRRTCESCAGGYLRLIRVP